MMENINGTKSPLPRRGLPVPPPEARPGGGAQRQAPGGRTFAHGVWLGSVQRGDVGPPLVGPKGSGTKSFRSDPRLQKLALGSWNATCVMVKEPELVDEVEKFRLDKVGLTLTHGKGSGTGLLERACTLSHSGVANSERRQAGVAIVVGTPQGRALLFPGAEVVKKLLGGRALGGWLRSPPGVL